MCAFGLPPHSRFFPDSSDIVPAAHHLLTLSTTVRRKQVASFLCSSLQEFCRFNHLPRVKDVWRKRVPVPEGFAFLETFSDVVSATCSSCLCFFSGKETDKDWGDKGKSRFETASRNYFDGRLWTNVLLAMNVMVYVGQISTQGKLMLWGAKINSLIDRGQLWRLVTSSFLHANIGHLMVNCYSLNSVGPAVEKVSGPKRFLAVYFTSVLASSAMSYYFCKAPAVGASGAIFGLVGSFAVFILRHRNLIGGGMEDLQHIVRVIVLNMAIGTLSKGIDNWGHLGGLLGGTAMSWFLGPAWRYESRLGDGRSVFTDKAPIVNLFGWKGRMR
ncbi:RHOMBOID-like protein 10, chloroplastic [Magnolia sinica]|uniref:RHOMBOID-like protein 10, chloroplastic n=1 Tax=Magnolia sinica TaxID=86752 RepID=UPI0026587279|nr:RHOMBOID-like protein 10, chloroplastic [Magnolia sinica]